VEFPVRLACVGSDGFPRVVSLWYQYQDGRLYCVTHRDSQLARLLAAETRVGFEVAPNSPPYRGVRGQGRATLAPLGEHNTLNELLQRYLGGVDSPLANWLLSRSEEELLITIEPLRLFSWDYSERMAGLEHE
jgi:nitroimidazol reductase NimA-like FMN-containing flavoprotein (pyridoxamine 5'-phosphate oxidase superfamily)